MVSSAAKRAKLDSLATPPPTSGNVQRKTDSNKVACPVCSLMLPPGFLNTHLDDCLTKQSVDVVLVPDSTTEVEAVLVERKPLPPVWYYGMNHKKLKDLCEEHGIPTHGNQQQLQKRHQEFTIRYNAQLDVRKPRSKRQIISEILEEEEAKKRPVPTTEIKATDVAFQQLIAQIKRQQPPREAKRPPPPELDTEAADPEAEPEVIGSSPIL